MKKPLREYDIHPTHLLRDEYGFNAENRPTFKINPEEVPEKFRSLIPCVERWGIRCDVTRGDYFDKQPLEDVADFYYSVLPQINEIQEWIRTQPEDVTQWSEAAGDFLYFLKAHDDAYQPTDEEIREKEERFKTWKYRQDLKQALSKSETLFRAKDYGNVVELLIPFEDGLDKVWSAKLNFARKKVSQV